jgi:hypothetical protein
MPESTIRVLRDDQTMQSLIKTVPVLKTLSEFSDEESMLKEKLHYWSQEVFEGRGKKIQAGHR